MPQVRQILTLVTFLLCSIHQIKAQTASSGKISPTVAEYFGIESNVTTVTWAHAVNSWELLNDTLKTDTMMLEADVVLGRLNTSQDNASIPIMGHPPANESDLSLEQFINAVLNDQTNNKRGIKLDFKTIDVFKASLPILAKVHSNMTFPVWLNADILAGPVNANETTPVDAEQFLAGAVETFPESTLSIGWTTRYGTNYNITEGSYSLEQITEMINTVNKYNVSQSITYPVRAGLAAQSTEAMKALISNSTNATLTLWSSDGDSVDGAKLSDLILEIGVDKVYIDVPDAVWDTINISSGASGVNMGALALGSILAAVAMIRLF